ERESCIPASLIGSLFHLLRLWMPSFRSHSFAVPLALEYNTTPASLWQALFSLFSIFFALLGVLDSFHAQIPFTLTQSLLFQYFCFLLYIGYYNTSYNRKKINFFVLFSLFHIFFPVKRHSENFALKIHFKFCLKPRNTRYCGYELDISLNSDMIISHRLSKLTKRTLIFPIEEASFYPHYKSRHGGAL
ncbi:MAG: hypothetical protein ACI4JC_05800, partial [Faecalibacterium sp.]